MIVKLIDKYLTQEEKLRVLGSVSRAARGTHHSKNDLKRNHVLDRFEGEVLQSFFNNLTGIGVKELEFEYLGFEKLNKRKMGNMGDRKTYRHNLYLGEQIIPLLTKYQIPMDATFEDIKRIYRKACLKCHPDALGPGTSDLKRKLACEEFSKMKRDFNIILNESTYWGGGGIF